MKKLLIGLLIVTLLVPTMLSGCKGDEQTLSDPAGDRMTITVGYPGADNSWKEDDYYRYIADKLNIDIDFKSLSADSASEKARIWISSGNMPDVVWSSFLMDEYAKYGEQGIVKTLPSDLKEKYPNLGFSVEMTGIYDKLEEVGNGSLYGLIRPLDHYSSYIDDFRAAYNEGKNLREMMNENEYRYLDSYGFAYRKDWAEKLGIETDYIMKYDDFIDMVLKFKEADLGGVGADNTIGIAVDYTEAPNIFITAFNSSYKYFHKDSTGKYVCGLLEDSTTQGVKAYADAYRKGVLSKDFYTQKTQDLDSLFCSQRAGVIFPRASSHVRDLMVNFGKANPDLVPEECIDVCWILSPDGKVHGREGSNAYSAYYFNPEISDEKLDRILKLADYVSSEEGGPQVRLGIPNVDYKAEGDDYVILRKKNEYGEYESLDEKYPSYEFFSAFLNPQYDVEVDMSEYPVKIANNLSAAKRMHELSLLDWDDDRDGYTAEDYIKFKAAYEVNSMFAEIVVSEGDVDKIWAKKRAEIEKAAKPVVANMNKALLK